jgi:hypothetical protein
VCGCARALADLGPLAWWGRPEAVWDLREAFAVQAPLVALEHEAFPWIRRWMRLGTGGTSGSAALGEVVFLPEDQVPTDMEPNARERFPHLSDLGYARWLALEGLTVLTRPGLNVEARCETLRGWAGLAWPLDRLEDADQRAFVAGIVAALEGFDPENLTHARSVSSLARLLVQGGYRGPLRRGDGPAPGARQAALLQNLAQELREERERAARGRGLGA